MSTLITHTAIFTGATLEELHDQIYKYAVKVGLAVEEKPVVAAPAAAKPTLAPPPMTGAPVVAPVAAPTPEFFGVDGSLLLYAPVDFERWCNQLVEIHNLSANFGQIKFAYSCLQAALVTMPPKLAAKAKELAAEHSYGAPEHLVAEYHYNRWMIAQEQKATSAIKYMKTLVGKNQDLHYQIDEMVALKGPFFQKHIFNLAVKLIKEHGWKGPTRWNLAGTEFQKAAIDASRAKLDGYPVSTSGFSSLDTYKLQEALKTQ